MERLPVEALVEAWRNGARADEAVEAVTDGCARGIPTCGWSGEDFRRTGVPLVIAFHGAIDRAKRTVPPFEGRPLRAALAGRAHLVGVSDPALLVSQTLRVGWYAGSEDHPVPDQLTRVIEALARALGSTRVVLAGGSTGGHPAMVQSSRLPGSVAVVQNPILRISAYYRRTVAEYRATCWPHLDAAQPLAAATIDDVATCYAEDRQNAVVLLQNALDHHLFPQSIAFLAKLKNDRNRKALLYLSEVFEEYRGHSFPKAEWARWVRAAVEAPTIDVEDIAAAARRLQPAREKPGQPTDEVEDRDLRIADALYRAALQEVN